MLPTFIASYLTALAATPLAIRVAFRTGFLDRPGSYKAHAGPTPYLGGAAVLAGVLAGALAYGRIGDSRFVPLLVCAAVIWFVGTADDRVALRPRLRVLAEISVAAVLWKAGLGWSLFPGELADLAVTVLWVVGIVNAYNLMDNLDGAAGTVAAVSAAGIVLLSLSDGPESLTALAVATSGACIGFLIFNLSKPARVFLGDGGSMLLGFLIAALAMAYCRMNVTPGSALLPAILLAGLPILDMTLVIISRTRRGAPVGKGARDHITHRLLPKLGSARLVALTLAVAQGALCLVAIEMMGWQRGDMLTGAGAAFVLGLITLAILESPLFRPQPVPDPAFRVGGAHELRLGPDQGSGPRTSEAARSGSTARSAGATSGRSLPSTELGP